MSLIYGCVIYTDQTHPSKQIRFSQKKLNKNRKILKTHFKMPGKAHYAATKPVGSLLTNEAARWVTLTFPNRTTNNKWLTCWSAAETSAIKVLLVWPSRGFLQSCILYSPFIFIVCILEGSALAIESFRVSSGLAAGLGVLSLFLIAVP